MLNQNWFADELRDRGHEVLVVGWDKKKTDVEITSPGSTIKKLLDDISPDFKPNRIIYHDNSGPIGFIGLEDLDIPSVFYSVDAHHHSWWHAVFSGLFDYTLVAQPDYLPKFREFNPQSQWFPLWAPYQLEPQEEKVCDVCFRGNLDPALHPQRAKFFSELGSLIDIDTQSGDYRKIFPQSKIVVNQAVKKDLNFRVFEVMMAGGLLLTPEIENGLTALFTPGEEIITYRDGDAKDAAEKIRFYLENESLRQEIAERGHQKVLSFHTKEKRAEQLEKILLELTIGSKPYRNFSAGHTYLATSVPCRALSNQLGDRFLLEAGRLFVRSADLGETSCQDYINSLAFCKYSLEARGFNDLAFETIKAVHQCYQDELVIAMSYLESLLQRSETKDAYEVAGKYSAKPEEFIAVIPEVSARMRNAFAEQLARC